MIEVASGRTLIIWSGFTDGAEPVSGDGRQER